MSDKAVLNLLVPSSTEGVALQCRVYLPASSGLASSTELTPLEELSADVKEGIKALGLRKLVTAAHPWGRLGGNQDFPVVARHLPAAVGPDTVVVTYNARGIGQSQGSQPWPGAYPGNDHLDFAAVEKAALELTGAKDIYRLGYSYGNIPALIAPLPPVLAGILLVSPAPVLFKALTVLRGPTFADGLQASVGATDNVVLVFGTKDDFTNVATLHELGGDRVKKVEVEGAQHFYDRKEDGLALQAAMREWIGNV